MGKFRIRFVSLDPIASKIFKSCNTPNGAGTGVYEKKSLYSQTCQDF